jgi:ElaB/YqjD/DUF883 family membrane-anchored ribosome-binding protein
MAPSDHPFPPHAGSAGDNGDNGAHPASAAAGADGAPASDAGEDHGSPPGRGDDDLLGRVVQGAHATIDRLAETAAPHVHRLQGGIDAAGEQLRARASQARAAGDEWAEPLRSTVRDNPLAAVAAAVALGVLIARLTR